MIQPLLLYKELRYLITGFLRVILHFIKFGNPFGINPMLVALPASFALFVIGNMIGPDIRNRASIQPAGN